MGSKEGRSPSVHSRLNPLRYRLQGSRIVGTDNVSLRQIPPEIFSHDTKNSVMIERMRALASLEQSAPEAEEVETHVAA